MDLAFENLLKNIKELYPDKVLVDISEYESESHETYKFLYDTLHAEHSKTVEELHTLVFDKQMLEQDCATLSKRVTELETQLSVLKASTLEMAEAVKTRIAREVIVCDVKIVPEQEPSGIDTDEFKKTISDTPGIYGKKRPGWFMETATALGAELSPKEVRQKNISHTTNVLKKILLFWKEYSNADKKADISKDYALKRKKNIIELLDSNCSNEEKFLKYLLLSPGLDKEFIKTLRGASEMNLNANLIIALLEQPCQMFNKEIIELYVSELHKGTEYNLKQELAMELLEGQWYITATIDGTLNKFQLVPIDELAQLHKKLDTIYTILTYMADEGICANLAQMPSDTREDESSILPDALEEEYSSYVEFDDSMLEN